MAKDKLYNNNNDGTAEFGADVDHNALKTDIVPRLLQDVPRQPTQQQLDENPHMARFYMVFDREGYSPVFFREMWVNHRIACISYHKYPGADWPAEEFQATTVKFPLGEEVSMLLAERGTRVGSAKEGLWVREIRKLTPSGHQTSIITTAFADLPEKIAVWMFSRWAQENFFGYMMQHFGLDLLSEYAVEDFPDTTRVVNPAWRELDRRRRSISSKLTQLRARFAAQVLCPEHNDLDFAQWKFDNGELIEEILQREQQADDLKEKLRQTPKHITMVELPENERFKHLAPGRKRLLDAVRMIAYRAETAMASILRPYLSDFNDARPLLRDLFCSEADIIPDLTKGLLHVCVHHMSNPRSNSAIGKLLEELNVAEMIYPGTNLTLCFSMGLPPSI